MKSSQFLILTLLACLNPLLAEPILDSWFTEHSGRYARIFPDNAAVDALAPVTTWNRGQGIQAEPTYAGVHEISYTTTDVYIRTTNLGFHLMGPWYGANGGIFVNYPANRAFAYRLPRNPVIQTGGKTETGLGVIGFFVDGVSAFDSRDAFSYDTSQGQDEEPQSPNTVSGDDVWNRDAYVNESVTFDPAFAHQAGPTYHYHASPRGLRHLLGDSVAYDAATHTYTEVPNGTHSPILGWMRDGLPVYGPYGYSDPNTLGGTVRRMISGYQKRDGSQGSVNIAITAGTDSIGQATGRTTLPQWVVRNQTGTTSTALLANQFGPAVSTDFPIGHYLEDYAYKGDLGLSLYTGAGTFNAATQFDLNEYNVRFCVTPEFPGGTWAYFTNVASDGTPVFPYNIGRYFFGSPTGSAVNAIPNNAVVHFEGGPEKALEICDITQDGVSDDVELIWSSVEGGSYTISSSDDLNQWQFLAATDGTDATMTLVDPGGSSSEDRQFYRVGRDSIAPFDDAGFDYDNSVVVAPAQNNILLLILDDWGIDASELYNPTGTVADMPNLKGLASNGLMFSRGYAQPICSPTRATILTGRQPYQHRVGNPTVDNTLSLAELTLPEILASDAPDYGLASYGKWHLGNGNTGPLTHGGWDNFAGIIAGGVSNYVQWNKTTIANGALVSEGVSTTVYTTVDQVNDAKNFVNGQGNDPWFVWMGFNAPHDPYQDPAPYVTPTNGYSTNGTTDSAYYIKALEALDHLVGDLLAEVDLTKTNVIVVGDNGTPNQTVQAPYGNGHAKGDLYEGGIHVPFFAAGPDVLQSGISDKLVHVSDLFATILELANVNVPNATAGVDHESTSLVPIFQGSDTADRCVISEKFGLNANNDGRSILMDDYPNYKLISVQDVTDPNDTPVYEMYDLSGDPNEMSPLSLPPNAGDAHEAAFLALVAKDESLVPSVSQLITVNIDLSPTATNPTVPPLVNTQNGNIVRPQGITIGGLAATSDTGDITVGGTTTSAARVDENGDPDRYSVVATFDIGLSGFTSGQAYTIQVTFPGNNRIFDATNSFVAP